MMKPTVRLILSIASIAHLSPLGFSLSLPPDNGVARTDVSTLERRAPAERELVFGADVLYFPDPDNVIPDDDREVDTIDSWLEFRVSDIDLPLRVQLITEASPHDPLRKIRLIQAAEVNGRASDLPTADKLRKEDVARYITTLTVRVSVTNDEIMSSIDGRGILFDVWSRDPEYRSGAPPKPDEQPRYNGGNRFIWNVLHHPRILGPDYRLEQEEPDVYAVMKTGIAFGETEEVRVVDRNVELTRGILTVSVKLGDWEGVKFKERTIFREAWRLSASNLIPTMDGLDISPVSEWTLRPEPDAIDSVYPGPLPSSPEESDWGSSQSLQSKGNLEQGWSPPENLPAPLFPRPGRNPWSSSSSGTDSNTAAAPVTFFVGDMEEEARPHRNPLASHPAHPRFWRETSNFWQGDSGDFDQLRWSR